MVDWQHLRRNGEGQMREVAALNITHIKEFCFTFALQKMKSYHCVSASCQQALGTTEVSMEPILAALMGHLQALLCSAYLFHSFFSSVCILCCIKDKHSLSEQVVKRKQR